MQTTDHTALERASLIALALLALTLPFEIVVFHAGPLALTSVELVLGLTLLLAAALVVVERRWRRRGWLRLPRAWLVLLAIAAAAFLLSALLAPTLRFNALKASGRLLTGMALALAVPQIVRDRRRLGWVALPLLLGTTVALGAGFVEVVNGRILPWLNHFRVTATTAGPFLRLTGSFGHANQAAMFLEATLPLLFALGLSLWPRPVRRGRPLAALLVGLVILIFLQGAVYTYSRTSVVTVLASSAVVAALLWWRSRRQAQAPSPWPWAGLSLAMLVVIGLNTLFNPVMQMRLSSEGDNEWYNLSFQAPQELTLEAGQTMTTTVTVRNEGLLTWADRGPNAVNVGGRWYLPGDSSSLAFVPRWSLPETVRPGESVTVEAPVRPPPQPGTYRLQWDLIQENVTWFSYKNGVRTMTSVTVVPSEASATPTPQEAQMDAELAQVVEAPPQLAPIPDRRTLWRAAASHFAQRPLLGMGLDNFRLRYGEVLETDGEWNQDIHANNWYIETLVSGGLLGALPFLAWMLLLGISTVRELGFRQATLWQTAIAAGLIAYFIHGLLDYFLMFNDTGIFFWLLTGLWISQYDDN
ncbi:MAG: NBR1-Ig-like domain-containing protein [Chloroflexota bacterium]